MPKYLVIGSYTATGAQGVLKEGGTKREEVARKLTESVGGTMDAFYFAFGSDDFYVLADLPDHAAAAAVTMTVAASGAIGARTVVLLTPQEVDAATKMSPSYRAPGA